MCWMHGCSSFLLFSSFSLWLLVLFTMNHSNPTLNTLLLISFWASYTMLLQYFLWDLQAQMNLSSQNICEVRKCADLHVIDREHATEVESKIWSNFGYPIWKTWGLILQSKEYIKSTLPVHKKVPADFGYNYKCWLFLQIRGLILHTRKVRIMCIIPQSYKRSHDLCFRVYDLIQWMELRPEVLTPVSFSSVMLWMDELEPDNSLTPSHCPV